MDRNVVKGNGVRIVGEMGVHLGGAHERERGKGGAVLKYQRKYGQII